MFILELDLYVMKKIFLNIEYSINQCMCLNTVPNNISDMYLVIIYDSSKFQRLIDDHNIYNIYSLSFNLYSRYLFTPINGVFFKHFN